LEGAWVGPTFGFPPKNQVFLKTGVTQEGYSQGFPTQSYLVGRLHSFPFQEVRSV